MSSKTIGMVAAYRALTKCGPEELAIQARQGTPSGGLMFARKKGFEQKREARNQILNLLGLEAFPTLHMLTMPGMRWSFERELLARREGNWQKTSEPVNTRITSIENDRFIYHAAITKMIGMGVRKIPTIEVRPATKFAERVIGNCFVPNFYFGNVDDLMRTPVEQYDVAWLDYTGPISIERVKLIKQFFESSVKRVMALTVLRARWNRETSDSITRAGGHTEWVLKRLPLKLACDPYDYQDSESPMAQFIFTKD